MIVATMISDKFDGQVAESLGSIQWLADQLLFVDTTPGGEFHGAAGFAAEVARVAGIQARVARFPWTGSFSEARNFALQKAGETGEHRYAMTLDSDEAMVIDPCATKREFLLAMARTENTVVLCPHVSLHYAKERFIRLDADLKWVGRSHEALVGDRREKTLDLVKFDERPKTTEQMEEKHRRDKLALALDMQEFPDDSRWKFYMAQTLEGCEAKLEAAELYLKVAQGDGWDAEAAWAAFRAASCYYSLGEKAKAIDACLAGLKKQASRPDLLWMAGLAFYGLGNYEQALAFGEMALGFASNRSHTKGLKAKGFKFVPAYFEKPHDLLAWTHRQLGNEEAAEKHFFLADVREAERETLQGL